MKPAINPKNVAALFDAALSPESKKFIHEQEQLELMDAMVIPFLEQNLFTFDSFQHLDPAWQPANQFEHWVDTKLYIHCEVVKMHGDYTITLKYSNGFLGGALVKNGSTIHYYSQMEMGWTRQY